MTSGGEMGGRCLCLWFFLLFGGSRVETGRGRHRAATARLCRRNRVLLLLLLLGGFQVHEEMSVEVGVASADQGIQ